MANYMFQQPGGGQVPAPPGAGYGAAAMSAEQHQAQLITKVYGWTFLGIGLSAAVSLLALPLFNVLAVLYLPIAIVTLIIAMVISFGINKLKAGTATALYVLYTMLMGLTLSVIVGAYAGVEGWGIVATAFFVTSGTFGLMSLIGLVTKRNLAKFGMFLMFALVGLVLTGLAMMVLSLFGVNVAAIYAVYTYVGLLIFLGLTVYETWLMKKMANSVEGAQAERKFAIIFALQLYLNFVNIFLFVLRILGGNRS